MSSSSFWSDAFSGLADNVALVNTAAQDFWANVIPGHDEFLSGTAPNTAAEVEKQLAAKEGREPSQARVDASSAGGFARIVDAAKDTASDVGKEAAAALDTAGKLAGGALDLVTGPALPWILGGVAVVALLVVAAPYVAPVVLKAAA